MLNPSITQKFKVDTLTDLGCKRWQKNNMDRVYLSETLLHQLLDIKVTYYNTGNISSFSQNGEALSNTQGSKVLHSLAYCKFYYDLVSDSYAYKHTQGCVDFHNTVFKRLDEYLSAKYNAHNKVKAEREVTLDEINEALGL